MNQIVLFQDWLQNPDTEYTLQWWTPYSALYPFIFIISALFEPLFAARLVTFFVVGSIVTAIHLLAYWEDRPHWNATLASILVFNCSLYWGFLPFIFGWVAFVMWLRILKHHVHTEPSLRNDLLLFASGLFLYASHALWFAAGLLWFGVYHLVYRAPFKQTIRRTIPVTALVAIGVLGYLKLQTTGFNSPTIYGEFPFERLSPGNLVDAILGGVKGPIEPMIIASLFGWMTLAIWQHRHELRKHVNSPLLLTAAMFFVLFLILPQKYQQTIMFAQRWASPALILCLLALPAPSIKLSLKSLLSLALLSGFTLATCLTWLTFEQQDLPGLEDALDNVGTSNKVLGLSFYTATDEDELFKYRSLIHIPAYSQLLHHGQTNFSFAEFGSMPVVYKEIHNRPWTINLEWYPENVTNEDFQFFDHVLVSGNDEQHEFFAQMPQLTPATQHGIWRLYNVQKDPKP